MRMSVLALMFALLCASPAHADGWFPKINGRGEIASGSGTITVNGRDLGAGWAPQWVNDDHIVFNAADETAIVNVRTGARQSVPLSYNFMAAGGGTWLGTIAAGAIPTHRYNSFTQRVLEVTNAGGPMASPSGRWGYVEPFHAHQKNIVVNGAVVASGVIVDAAISDRAAVWTIATSVHGRATFAIIDGAPARDVSILPWEAPSACDGPDGVWVLSVTQGGLALRPAGATSGFYWPGEFFNPACRFVNGAFRIASSSSRGVLQVMDIAPSAASPRVLYSTLPEAPVKAQCEDGLDNDGDGFTDLADPGCKATNDNDETPEGGPQLPQLPQAVCTILVEERGRYGAAPHGAELGDILNRTAWRANGNSASGDWGLSGKDFGNYCESKAGRVACDILHRKSDNVIWDVLGAAGDGGPGTPPDCNRPPEALGPPPGSNRPFVKPGDPGGKPIDPKLAELEKKLAEALIAEAVALRARDEARARVGELEGERDGLKRQIEDRAAEIQQLRREIEDLRSKPTGTCFVSGPGWVRQIFGIRCEVR